MTQVISRSVLETVAQLEPLIRQHAAEAEANRGLHPEVHQAMLEAGLFDLVSAFRELLERRKTLLAHEVADSGKTVDQRMEELMELIREGESVEVLELFASQETKADMIVTFLALLELIRLKRVKVYQRGVFGAIRVFRPLGPDAVVPVG